MAGAFQAKELWQLALIALHNTTKAPPREAVQRKCQKKVKGKITRNIQLRSQFSVVQESIVYIKHKDYSYLSESTPRIVPALRPQYTGKKKEKKQKKKKKKKEEKKGRKKGEENGMIRLL